MWSLVGFRRGYATVSQSLSPAELIARATGRMSAYVKQEKYGGLKSPLIRKNFDEAFLKKSESDLLNAIHKIAANATSKANYVSEISKQAVFSHFIAPNENSVGQLVRYVADHQDDLSSIPWSFPKDIEDSEKAQYVVDGIIEQLLYNRMKPYKLQALYNDASNSQNFNKDLTFNIMDVDNPYEWFPGARRLKRKFVMHVGPTNSGKTYRALQRLENCSKGYFAGPLRLLAREVYDKFQSKGIPCNLVTGEEVIVDVDEDGNKAGVTSGTIEMLSLAENYDVVVVDEIQMIGDEFRGSAWTNAVLGARAKEIHLCGEASAVPLIKKLVEKTGDDLEINEYDRLGKLVVDKQTIGMHDLRRGDCVVCFSKTTILDMKLQIEKQTSLKCAVIYGALPPETRSQEAQRFNDGFYDVVVASDAIGMGLNLKIHRVIFTTTQKYNGRANVELTASNVKQIGGRAGRYGVGGASVGHISAIADDDLNVVREAMDTPVEPLETAVLWPPDALWIRYYSMFSKGTTAITMFRKFESDLGKLYRRDPQSRNFQIQSLDDKKMMGNFFSREKIGSDTTGRFNIADQLRCLSAPTTLTTNSLQPLKVVLDDVLRQFVLNIVSHEKRSIFDFNSIPLYLLSTEGIIRTGPMKNKSLSTKGSPFIEPEPIPSSLKGSMMDSMVKQETDTYHQKRAHIRRVNPVEDRLVKLEQFHKMLGSYMWLSYRFPQNFIDMESVGELKELTEFKISEMLGSLRAASVGSRRFRTFSH